MSRYIALGLAMLVGAALGGAAVNGLHAQGKIPGAYAILDISEIVDPDLLKQIVAKAAPPVKAGGGQYLARTEKITGLSGTPAQARCNSRVRQQRSGQVLVQLAGTRRSQRHGC